MKTIRSSVLAMVFLFFLTSAYSQQPGGQRQRMSPEERVKAEVEWMTKELKLKDKEAKKIEEISLKYAKKQEAEMQKMRDSGNREGMREVFGKINEEKNKEYKAILGEKNYEKYLKLLEERRQNMRQRGPRG